MNARADLLAPEPAADGAALLSRPRARIDIDADMDITPMIDITFLLLIFFLVATTPDQSTAVHLPEARHGLGVGVRDSVVFTVGTGGLDSAPVFAADGKLPEFRLDDDLSQQRQQIVSTVERGFRENKSSVLIKADRGVAHRDVARVIRAASQVAGVTIHLAVLEVD